MGSSHSSGFFDIKRCVKGNVGITFLYLRIYHFVTDFVTDDLLLFFQAVSAALPACDGC